MGRAILTSLQVVFLDSVRQEPELCRRFYLTGGTALAAFYLNHRESEDLDFFSEEEVDPLAIDAFFKSRKKEIGFRTFEFQKSFNRNLFFINFADGVLQAEFTYFPFPPVAQRLQDGALQIDSLRDIAVNKVFTITQQTRSRDFVDLFLILKKEGWQIADLLRDARVKFDASIDLIQLGAQLLRVHEVKDMPRMRVPLNWDAVVSFFETEARRLKKSIFASYTGS